jgi:hypothetical protein
MGTRRRRHHHASRVQSPYQRLVRAEEALKHLLHRVERVVDELLQRVADLRVADRSLELGLDR